jgi:hypothetical protein
MYFQCIFVSLQFFWSEFILKVAFTAALASGLRWEQFLGNKFIDFWPMCKPDPFATMTAVAEVHALVMISLGMQLEEDQCICQMILCFLTLTLNPIRCRLNEDMGRLVFTPHPSSWLN